SAAENFVLKYHKAQSKENSLRAYRLILNQFVMRLQGKWWTSLPDHGKETIRADRTVFLEARILLRDLPGYGCHRVLQKGES
ncbi:MAG: hypothetical protein MUP74_02475, partial [Desulfobacterales bacterium]|nr:hypothetical protein [Desulfobacterales bacterium]